MWWWWLWACASVEPPPEVDPPLVQDDCTLESALPEFAGACETQLVPQPPRGFLDVSGTDQARCDTFDWDFESVNHAIVLSDDPADYPLVIRVDPQKFSEPCEACENLEGITTTFGLAFTVPDTLLRDPRMTVVVQVPSPWSVVSGGTGKAGSWPCLSGYQEFGAPLACQNNPFGDFGIATDVADAGPVEVLVSIDPILSEWNCCPYVCDP